MASGIQTEEQLVCMESAFAWKTSTENPLAAEPLKSTGLTLGCLQSLHCGSFRSHRRDLGSVLLSSCNRSRGAQELKEDEMVSMSNTRTILRKASTPVCLSWDFNNDRITLGDLYLTPVETFSKSY